MLFTHVLLHYYAYFIPRLAYVGINFDKQTQYSPLLLLDITATISLSFSLVWLDE